MPPEGSAKHSVLRKEWLSQGYGRLLGIDLGARRVGVAVTDETRTSVRPLPFVPRSNWKRLLEDISRLCREFDVRGVVVGLPLRLDGTEGEAAGEARRIARNLELSLSLPVQLQDERLTSRVADERLRAAGLGPRERNARVDGEAAALILSDFLSRPGPENSGE
jgi:putative holliday junction resolvase